MRAIYRLSGLFSLLAILSPVSTVEARISFRRSQDLSVSVLDANPRSVALADLQKDGRADIVAVDMENDGVTVFVNDGQGTFGGPQMFETGAGPITLATADFDQNRFVDIAVGNLDDELSVTVLFGDGTGALGLRRDFGDSLDPVAMVAADFTGDRVDDLAVLSDDVVNIFTNNGDGSFAPDPITVETDSTGAFSIVAGLFNGDNNVDLAISNRDPGDTNVVVLLGRGDGTFNSPVRLLLADQPRDLVVAQLLGGTAQDIAVILERTGAEPDRNVQILSGNGDGTFQSSNPRTTAGLDSVGVDAADLDGDTRVDLAVTNTGGGQGLDALRNDPDGADPDSEAGFAQVVIPGLGAAVAVRIAGGCDRRALPNENCPPDINGDSRPDLIALNQDGDTIAVLLNTTGDATPTRPPTATRTPTPRVRINIGTAIGRPGDSVEVTVSLVTSGLSVAATGNDILFDATVLNVGGSFGLPISGATPTPPPCRIDRRIGKALTSSFDIGSNPGTARFFVVPDDNAGPIPDGPLYSCTFQIAPSALPGSYPITSTLAIAFTPAGTPLDDVAGSNGSVTVSLFVQSETPSATPNGGGGCSTHPTDSLGFSGLWLVIGPALVVWGRAKLHKRGQSIGHV